MINLPKFGISFGSREVKKSLKGATIAGTGAVAYSILLNAGIVAGLSVAVNMVLLFIAQSDNEG